jgi:16S rRNA (adenine1518-N6/adenine1519-N6)-dimethyltransferase
MLLIKQQKQQKIFLGSKNNIPIKKSWGQNFLIDKNTINKIIEIIEPNNKDSILEIGPGHGALTRELLHLSKNLCVIEIDPMLCENLKNKYSNLEIVNKDVLKWDNNTIDYNKIVGNIPYNISSQIIFKFLNKKWNTMILMVQKELAKRITSPEGSKKYGRISVMVQNFCKVEYMCDISKNVFHPKPKVDSGILKFNKINTSIDIDKFSLFIKEAFKQRRKKLKNNLKNICDYKLIEEYAEKRPEEISPKTYLILFNKIYF